MDKHELTELLNDVAAGRVSADDAALRLKMQPFMEIGDYAKVDMHRGVRQGVRVRQRRRPVVIEFWQGRPSRLHDRLQYTLEADGTWKRERLAP